MIMAVRQAGSRQASAWNGLSVTFMNINEMGLDPNQAYESEWLGGLGGNAEKKIGGAETLTFNGMGLIMVECLGDEADDNRSIDPFAPTLDARAKQDRDGRP